MEDTINPQIAITDKRWLTIADFAALFNISKTTQQNMRNDRVLPFSKIGKMVRYDRIEIDKFFESNAVVA